MEKISVIIPVYKSEQVLKKCINSIISQTYPNLEIILVDDGSPDHSGIICDDYSKIDSRIKVIHQKNSGVSVARNNGLKNATGDYCIFLDSDDYIEPIMYQSMIQIAKQYNCDVVMCDCVKECGGNKQLYTHNIRSGYYNRHQIETEYFQNLLIMPNIEYPPTISNCLVLFKRSLAVENQLYYEEGIRFSEDWLFGAELLYCANSFYYMKGQSFYHYWMNPCSATHTFTIDKWKDYQLLYKRINDEFSKCEIYDFSKQIDLVLLFLVYNAVGEIISEESIDIKKKQKICNAILHEIEVKQMFKRLRILSLPVTTKLKFLTLIYKYRIGFTLLILRGK